MATATAQEQPPPVQLTANEKFFRYFQHEVTDLQEQIGRIAHNTPLGGERADAIDHCLSAISRLSNEVQDASSYIPAYDQRTYGDAIKALNQKLQDVKATSAPKPKFAFKPGSIFTAKKNESAISLNDAAELARQRQRQIAEGPLADRSNTSSYINTPADSFTPANEREDNDDIPETGDLEPKDESSPNSTARIRQPSFSQSKAVTISNHEKVHIVLPTAASHATSSGTVSNLSRCVIDMSQPTTHGQPFATLTLKNISSSLIICGHVSGAAHLTNIKDSVIVVASRQFRMHESRNCDVYLLATSRPIIEDCHGIRFAPLPELYLREGNAQTENQWEKIDDFKWLRNEPSPNWSVLQAGERIKESVWMDKVPGGPELGVEDILSAVGVAK